MGGAKPKRRLYVMEQKQDIGWVPIGRVRSRERDVRQEDLKGIPGYHRHLYRVATYARIDVPDPSP